MLRSTTSWASVILTESFVVFLSPSEKYATAHRLGSWGLASKFLLFQYSPVILSLASVYSEMLRASWNEAQWKAWLMRWKVSVQWAKQMTDPASRQRGRSTETGQQIPDPNSWEGSNIWSNAHKVGSTPRHTDRRVTLTLTYKGQTRPLVREGSPQRQDNKLQTQTLEKEALSGQTSTKWARHQDWLTDWLTVSRKVTDSDYDSDSEQCVAFFVRYVPGIDLGLGDGYYNRSINITSVPMEERWWITCSVHSLYVQYQLTRWAHVVTDCQSVYPSWCWAPPCSRGQNFSFLLPENCFALRLGATSLTRGQVYNLSYNMSVVRVAEDHKNYLRH
jgi:hypothetical protein